MRGRVHAISTLKGLVADLRIPVVDGPFIGVGITGLVLEASDNCNIYEATNITDTVSGTFSEPTDGEVMTAKEFNDYVTQTTEMLKMNSGL